MTRTTIPPLEREREGDNMKQFFTNLLTLPYRMWMLGLGYYVWCNDCHTIVAGGFGYTDKNGDHRFACIPCAIKMSEEKNHE